MTINFIEFEVVFKINESQKYTIYHIFNNTTILCLYVKIIKINTAKSDSTIAVHRTPKGQ